MPSFYIPIKEDPVMYFSYQLSCVISVPKQQLLAHAFHYSVDKASINTTYNSPEKCITLIEKTLHDIFQPMIQEYADEYGLQLSDININHYFVTSGHPDITVSFMKDGIEKKFETTDSMMMVIAYYHKDSNLGYGLELYDYVSTLPNNTYSLRVGKEVPEGDVNLSFVHTPSLNVEENLSFIDTSYVDDNVIPIDQLESLVVPDEQGVLNYADMLSDTQPLVKRAPYDRIPSKDINLTRRFMNNQLNIANALFYKFDIMYHYDSEAGLPGKVSIYKGSQIQITDENGNPLNPNQYPYMIYVRCMENNPKIYWVKIYLQINTDENNTFKVRYNHVDSVLPDDQLKSVQKTIELYSNEGSLHFIEGGKLRIINGVGAYEMADMATVNAANELEEIFASEEQSDRDGYRVVIPQKAQADPRTKTAFHYKLSGTFTDNENQKHTITFGYISDWVINPEALLEHEKYDYTNNQKSIGLKVGMNFLNARNLIKMVMPIDMPDLPSDTVFTIEDASGQITYLTEQAADNSQVDTSVDQQGSQVPSAIATTQSKPWDGINAPNVKMVSNPISHVVTIFPEQQKNEFNFKWKASGSGYVDSVLKYQNQYKIAQDIYILEENTKKIYDVYKHWGYIGTQGSQNNWTYNSSTDILMNTDNFDTLTGYYDTTSMNKTDYRFSAIINIKDTGDDDVIALLFRINSSKQFYAFMWQKQVPTKYPGCAHKVFSNRGEDFVVYPTSKATDPYLGTDDFNAFLNWPDSFQQKNKKIFKATPSILPPYDKNL